MKDAVVAAARAGLVNSKGKEDGGSALRPWVVHEAGWKGKRVQVEDAVVAAP